MATLIFVDKENGEPGTLVAPKDGLKLGSGPSAKALEGRAQVSAPLVSKRFDGPPALPKAARKALGTVNRPIEKSVKTNGPLKQKQSSAAKKITEKNVKAKNPVPASDDTYPEIEKFFPFNPLDFESFDLPEEHQVAHLPLNGVPLMILDEQRELEKLLQLGPPTPVKMASTPWEAGPLPSPSSILSALDVDLPPVCYDMDI
nr:securin isoform X1 [Oryctolagus cuniculus]XP_008253574.2 securin isoform X1 [Oryctolagus cuniculus]